MSDFEPPSLPIGSMVLFHSDPLNPCEPQIGWIIKPGKSTVNILCFSNNSGFVEKTSVRHKDDPFWRESDSAASWMKWGAYTPHPDTVALQEVKSLVTRLKVKNAKADA